MLPDDEHLTGSDMKSTSHCKAATIICIMAALILSSCIYEAPGDRFYRTLWESGPDTPFGTVTLEFLCGEQISVSAPGCIGSFGRYIPSGTSATLDGLSLTVDGLEAAITHAVRNGDALTLTWYNVTDDGTASAGALSTVIPASAGAHGLHSGASLPSDGTIVMHRLSEYR